VPADVRRRILGPHLTAFLSYLTGVLHVSRRGVTDLVRTAFGVPVSLGTVSQREADTSAALAPAYDTAVQAAQAASVQYQDETGWADHGQLCWLWTVASDAAVVFQIQVSRSQDARRTLAGTGRGVTVSDRYSAYHDLPARRRQLCWAHLKRDFQKWVDRGDPSGIGTAGQAAVRGLFDAWHQFRADGDRAALQRRLRPVRRTLWQALGAALDDDDVRVVNFAANLRKVWTALWTFARVPGVEPTNNRAERALRPAVVLRKKSYGNASDRGLRFTERILTVAATVQQQGRSVWQYLSAALSALWHGHQAPTLLTTG
jgi:transposase